MHQSQKTSVAEKTEPHTTEVSVINISPSATNYNHANESSFFPPQSRPTLDKKVFHSFMSSAVPLTASRVRPLEFRENTFEVSNPQQARCRSSSMFRGQQLGCVRHLTETTLTLVGSAVGRREKYEYELDMCFVPIELDANGVGDAHEKSNECASQEEVFDNFMAPLIETARQGYYVTVVAYGASGTGKTFSVFGTPSAPGLAPRTLRQLVPFRIKSGSSPLVSVEMSLYEIYNENVRDLLNPQHIDRVLRVRQTARRGTFIDGLTKVFVANEMQARQLLEEGLILRTVGTTNQNAHSSRGHVVFHLFIHIPAAEKAARYSELIIADLAGAERCEAFGNANVAESSTMIHKSLSRLEDCFNALLGETCESVDSIAKDSQLTMLINRVFVGQSVLGVIGTISPATIAIPESKKTLQLVSSLRRIRLPPALQPNDNPTAKLIVELTEEIAEVKKKLRELERGGTSVILSGVKMSKPELLQRLVESTELLQEASESDEEKRSKYRTFIQQHQKHVTRLRASNRIPVNTSVPRLHTLNEDLAVNHPGMQPIYYLPDGDNTVGKAETASVVLRTKSEQVGLLHLHISVNSLQRQVFASMPSDNNDGLNGDYEIFINGERLKTGDCNRLLQHMDRLVIGPFAFRHAQPATWLAETEANGATIRLAECFSRKLVSACHAELLEEYDRLGILDEQFHGMCLMAGEGTALGTMPDIYEIRHSRYCRLQFCNERKGILRGPRTETSTWRGSRRMQTVCAKLQ
jgi:hypothetical protein